MKSPRENYIVNFNESLTDYIDSIGSKITDSEYIFLKKAFSINKEQRPFSVGDFSYMSQGSFRQLILRLRPIIQIVTKSRPCFYKLKGTYMSGDSHKITKKVMGEDMFEILQRLREQPAAIHDIKIMFKNTNLHENLLRNGFKQHTKNKGIQVKIPAYHQNIIIKCMIYPNTVQIDVGCSYRPIVYDISGVILLSSILGEVFAFLNYCSFEKSDIPEVNSWMITHYHFGKDGRETYSGSRFHHTFEETSEGLVRFYTKVMPNGKIIPRFEQIQTPHQTLNKEIEDMMIHQAKI